MPWSEILRTRSLVAANGTLLAAKLALQTGVACHAAGGTHHAHSDFGAGFCVFNDLAYASRALIELKLAKEFLFLTVMSIKEMERQEYSQMIKIFLLVQSIVLRTIQKKKPEAIWIFQFPEGLAMSNI